MQVVETWHFQAESDRINWRIDRQYLSDGELEDAALPEWDFANMSTWTGGLLGHGGVAWCRLFDQPGATYGVHTGSVTFWNNDSRAALRITPRVPARTQVATRFSRQTNDAFVCSYTVSQQPMVTSHGLSRFLHNRQDVWAPFRVRRGSVSVEFSLEALDYDQAFEPGVSPKLDTRAIREIRHTIARIGAIDELIHGSNGYYSDVAVLHEPWLAQLGLLIDDPAYTHALARTLDFQREHAIGSDGRVKSRWAGTAGDAMPGTYDRFGFYEAQWGYLLDSQTSWVINVAELFDLTGDRTWLKRQKTACERVLEYLLRRDSDHNGLVEMMTASEKEARGSDWLDVVWASHENAVVNAQLYWALLRWADREADLADRPRAESYRSLARRLKEQFNRPTTDGGFWDAPNQCYAYWRDLDHSVHGTNMVVPVNFSALGYGLCDDRERRAAILNRMESLMQTERLFFWPLCFLSFAPGEADKSQYPFPTYENGDLFLAWGELGTRAYAADAPDIALRYVRNVLAQYQHDGLAFQRYERRSQTGTGSDILANNCSTIVGLFRNIYGVQPKHDRLYFEPHLVPELDGTKLSYQLRGQTYELNLAADSHRMEVDGFAVSDTRPFALAVQDNRAQYFTSDSTPWCMSVGRSSRVPVELRILSWSADATAPRRWTQACSEAGVSLTYAITGLAPKRSYQLLRAGITRATLKADSRGQVHFRVPAKSATLVISPTVR